MRQKGCGGVVIIGVGSVRMYGGGGGSLWRRGMAFVRPGMSPPPPMVGAIDYGESGGGMHGCGSEAPPPEEAGHGGGEKGAQWNGGEYCYWCG